MSLPASADILSSLRQHFNDVVLPMWRTRGFNAGLGLPFEALDASGRQPMPVQRYRAMACARQIFVFSRAPGGQAHAGALFDTLVRVFRNPQGGWYYSVDAQGKALDETQDLYTHAFIVLACAALFERTRRRDAHQLLLATVRDIEARFRDAAGRYIAACDTQGRALRGPEQNPVMHLTEAYLAAAGLVEPAWFAECLRGLANQVLELYVDARSHCVLEFGDGRHDNHIEPGHQFEWVALLDSAPEVFAGLELAAVLPRAAAWAEARGVAADTAGVCAALHPDGSIKDASQRIWAQTEYARYLGLAVSAAPPQRRAWQLQALQTRFLHDKGWHEVLGPQGEVLRADMPSTTPYHLWTGYVATS